MQARIHRIFSLSETCTPAEITLKALHWAAQADHFHFFTDNGLGVNYPNGGFPVMLAAGARQIVPLRKGMVFSDLQDFHGQNDEWLIGHLGYDLKNEIENLASRNPGSVHFPDAFFYVPEHLVWFRENTLEIATSGDPELVFTAILATEATPGNPPFTGKIQQRTPRDKYLQTVEKLRGHILDGDVYEINYCMEFFAENAPINPLQTYLALNRLSPMPFSVFGKTGNQYLLCASPERFLKKTGSRLISMPIKGTAKRGSTVLEDTILKEQLRGSEKERAENMMIVDLVRNDLARSAVPGTTRVDEMFGIYTFAALHQMISTVSARVRPGAGLAEIIRNAFPMGSMTGAPKIRAMQLIDDYEDARRGLYSGAVGYVAPGGDFDFNVVIRSILYDAHRQHLSFSVGSAVTYDADAGQEYEECLLKAETMRRALQPGGQP